MCIEKTPLKAKIDCKAIFKMQGWYWRGKSAVKESLIICERLPRPKELKGKTENEKETVQSRVAKAARYDDQLNLYA